MKKIEEFPLFLPQFPDFPSHAIPTLFLQIAQKERFQPPQTTKMDWLLASELADSEPILQNKLTELFSRFYAVRFWGRSVHLRPYRNGKVESICQKACMSHAGRLQGGCCTRWPPEAIPTWIILLFCSICSSAILYHLYPYCLDQACKETIMCSVWTMQSKSGFGNGSEERQVKLIMLTCFFYNCNWHHSISANHPP